MQVDEYADADRREVNPPIEVESATWFTGVLVAFARYSRDSSFASFAPTKASYSPWRLDRSSVPSSEVSSSVPSPKPC